MSPRRSLALLLCLSATALGLGMPGKDAAAAALLVDEFDDGSIATNNGLGSGFEPYAVNAFASVDEDATVPGAVYIDMQGNAVLTALGGIRSLDTFSPPTVPSEVTRIVWSINAATIDPGDRYLLGFNDAAFGRRLEVNFWGTTTSNPSNTNEISFFFLDGSGGGATAFSVLHGVSWGTSFEVVVEISEGGWSVDWGFGSQSGPWSGGFDFATYAAGPLHVYALAGEEQGAGTTPATLVVDRITVGESSAIPALPGLGLVAGALALLVVVLLARRPTRS